MDYQFFHVVVGLRGAIAYALSLHLQFSDETRHVIVTTTLIIVLFTTLVFGGATMPMMKVLCCIRQFFFLFAHEFQILRDKPWRKRCQWSLLKICWTHSDFLCILYPVFIFKQCNFLIMKSCLGIRHWLIVSVLVWDWPDHSVYMQACPIDLWHVRNISHWLPTYGLWNHASICVSSTSWM